jgi:hypothetical protein
MPLLGRRTATTGWIRNETQGSGISVFPAHHDSAKAGGSKNKKDGTAEQFR